MRPTYPVTELLGDGIGDAIVDKRILEAKGLAVALNASLCVEYEAIVAFVLAQTLNIIGEHAIQPAHAVFTANLDP